MIIDAHVYSLPEILRNRHYTFPSDEVNAPAALHRHSDVDEAEYALSLSSPQEILRSMQECGIDKVALTALPWNTVSICKEHSEHILSEAKICESFISVCSIQPKDLSWEKHFINCVDNGAVGFAINPVWQSFTLDSAECVRLANYCAEAGVFLQIHIDHIFKSSAASAAALCSMLSKCPNTKVLATHLGGLLGVYILHPPVAKLLKNVWFDTSVSSTMQFVDFYIQVGLSNKLVYGSDFPFNHCHSQRDVLYALKNRQYGTEIMQGIFYKNFQTLCNKNF